MIPYHSIVYSSASLLHILFRKLSFSKLSSVVSRIGHEFSFSHSPRAGDVKTVKYLAEKLGDVNFFDPKVYANICHSLSTPGNKKKTLETQITLTRSLQTGSFPIHIAAHLGNSEMVSVLISGGAMVDSLDHVGPQPNCTCGYRIVIRNFGPHYSSRPWLVIWKL